MIFWYRLALTCGNTMKNPFRLGSILTLLVTVTLLTACGFHLRGTMDINSDIARLAVAGDDPAYIQQLTRALTNSGIEVTDSAPYRLRVLQVKKDTGKQSHASVGFYERLLKLSIRYRLETQDNLKLFEPVEFSAERYVSQDKNLTNAAQSEQSLVFQELGQELLFRTINQVTAIPGEKLRNEEARVRKIQAMEQEKQQSEQQTGSE